MLLVLSSQPMASLSRLVLSVINSTSTHIDSLEPFNPLIISYRAPGNVVDYMYAKAGIKFSYAVHLRDTGTARILVDRPYIAILTHNLLLVRLPPSFRVDPSCG